MPAVYLRLISIECHEMEDFLVRDEPYLRINRETVWSGKMSPLDDPIDLGNVDVYPFYETAKIELWDKDMGYLDKDDFLGGIYVDASFAGKGIRKAKFTRDGANYTLTFEVLKERERSNE